MGHHDRRYACSHGRLERGQVNAVHLFTGVRDLRKSEMAVGGRIAVTGEMLGRGQDARTVEAGDLPDNGVRHDLREGTR